MTITVYGASDDLIELEGDITEELIPPDDGPNYLGFSDGTLLSVAYDDAGGWAIRVIKQGVTTSAEVTLRDPADDDDVTDRVVLSNLIDSVAPVALWVMLGPKDNVVRAKPTT